MTILDDLIEAAFKSEGEQSAVNQVYLNFLSATLYVPTQKITPESTPSDEPFLPLFATIDERIFMVVFDTLDRLKTWAGDHFTKMDYVELSGREVIVGIQNQVYLSLNIGSPFHKEFAPDEIQHLKKVIARVNTLT